MPSTIPWDSITSAHFFNTDGTERKDGLLAGAFVGKIGSLRSDDGNVNDNATNQ